jgi:hypothetical protein
MFVPMNNFFQYWSLLGYLRDQEQDINPEKYRLKEISNQNDTSAESGRADDNITPAPLHGFEVLTRPEYYGFVSRARKRRMRAAQLK